MVDEICILQMKYLPSVNVKVLSSSRSRYCASPCGFDFGLRPPLRMTQGEECTYFNFFKIFLDKPKKILYND